MQKVEKKLPNSKLELVFKINEEELIFNIKFPKTGELIDIENDKKLIANNNYRGFNLQDNSTSFAKMSIDTIATFQTLLPDLISNFNVKNYFEMELIDMKRLISVYAKQFLPWYNEWITILSNFEDENE
jgi:hypothetical protein